MTGRGLRNVYEGLYPGRNHSRLILPEDFYRAEAATTPHIASDFRQWMQGLISELRETYEIIRDGAVTLMESNRIVVRDRQRADEDLREASREWENVVGQWEAIEHQEQRLQEMQESNEEARNDIRNLERVLAREKEHPTGISAELQDQLEELHREREELAGIWVGLKDGLEEIQRERAEIRRERVVRWLEDEKLEVAASAEVEVEVEAEVEAESEDKREDESEAKAKAKAESEDEATGDEPVSVVSAPVSSGDGEEKAKMFAGMFEPILEATTRWLAKQSDAKLGDKSDSGRTLRLQDELRHLNSVMEDGYSLDIAGRKRTLEIVTELWTIVDPPVEGEKPSLS